MGAAVVGIVGGPVAAVGGVRDAIEAAAGQEGPFAFGVRAGGHVELRAELSQWRVTVEPRGRVKVMSWRGAPMR